MMYLVPSNDKSQGAHGDFVAVSRSTPGPVTGSQMSEEYKSCSANRFQFFNQTGQRNVRMRAVTNIVVLLEAWHRSAVVASNTQRTISHDALGIDDMAQRLLHAPLALGVAQVTVLLVSAREQGNRLWKLARERGNDIIAGDQRNVAVVIGVVLTGFWTL